MLLVKPISGRQEHKHFATSYGWVCTGVSFLFLHLFTLTELKTAEICEEIECPKPRQTLQCTATTVHQPKVSSKLGPFKDCCSLYQCRDFTDAYFLYTGIAEKGTDNRELDPRPGQPFNSIYPDEKDKEAVGRMKTCPLYIPFSFVCQMKYETTPMLQKLLQGNANECPISHCTERSDANKVTRTFRELIGQFPSNRQEVEMEKGRPTTGRRCPLVNCTEKPVVLSNQICELEIVENRLDSAEIEALGEFVECCPKLWHCKPSTGFGLEYMTYEIIGSSFRYFSVILFDLLATKDNRLPKQCNNVRCPSVARDGPFSCVHDITGADEAILKFAGDQIDCCPVYKCYNNKGRPRHGLILMEGPPPDVIQNMVKCDDVTCGKRMSAWGAECKPVPREMSDILTLGKLLGHVKSCCPVLQCNSKGMAHYVLEIRGQFNYREIQSGPMKVKDMFVIVAGNKRLALMMKANNKNLPDLEIQEVEWESFQNETMILEMSKAETKIKELMITVTEQSVVKHEEIVEEVTEVTNSSSQSYGNTQEDVEVRRLEEAIEAATSHLEAAVILPTNFVISSATSVAEPTSTEGGDKDKPKDRHKENNGQNGEEESASSGYGNCEGSRCPILDLGKEKDCEINSGDEDARKYFSKKERCCSLTHCYDSRKNVHETHYVKFTGWIPITESEIVEEKGKEKGVGTNRCPKVTCDLDSTKRNNSSCFVESKMDVSLAVAKPFIECCPVITCMNPGGSYSTELSIISASFSYYEYSYFNIKKWNSKAENEMKQETGAELVITVASTTPPPSPITSTPAPEIRSIPSTQVQEIELTTETVQNEPSSNSTLRAPQYLISFKIGNGECDKSDICAMLNLAEGKQCNYSDISEVAIPYFPQNEQCCPLIHCLDPIKKKYETHYVKITGEVPITSEEIEKEKGVAQERTLGSLGSSACPKIHCGSKSFTSLGDPKPFTWFIEPDENDTVVNPQVKPFLHCCPMIKCIKQMGKYLVTSVEVQIMSSSFAYYELSHYDIKYWGNQKDDNETNDEQATNTTDHPPKEMPNDKEKDAFKDGTITNAKLTSSVQIGTGKCDQSDSCPTLNLEGLKCSTDTSEHMAKYLPENERCCASTHCFNETNKRHQTHYVKFTGRIPTTREEIQIETGELEGRTFSSLGSFSCPQVRCGNASYSRFGEPKLLTWFIEPDENDIVISPHVIPFMKCCPMIKTIRQLGKYLVTSLEIYIISQSFSYYELSHYDIRRWGDEKDSGEKETENESTTPKQIKEEETTDGAAPLKIGTGKCDKNDSCPKPKFDGVDCSVDTSEHMAKYMPENERCCPSTHCFNANKKRHETHYVKVSGRIPTIPGEIDKEKGVRNGSISCPKVRCEKASHAMVGEEQSSIRFIDPDANDTTVNTDVTPFLDCCTINKRIQKMGKHFVTALEVHIISSSFSYYELSYYDIRLWGNEKDPDDIGDANANLTDSPSTAIPNVKQNDTSTSNLNNTSTSNLSYTSTSNFNNITSTSNFNNITSTSNFNNTTLTSNSNNTSKSNLSNTSTSNLNNTSTSNLNNTSTSNLNNTSTSNLSNTSTSNLNNTSTSNLNNTSTSNLNNAKIETKKQEEVCPGLKSEGTCQSMITPMVHQYVPFKERGCTPYQCVDLNKTQTIHYVKYTGLIPSGCEVEKIESEKGSSLDKGHCPNITCAMESAMPKSENCTLSSPSDSETGLISLIRPFIGCCNTIKCGREENSYSLERKITAPSFSYYEISYYNLKTWNNQTNGPTSWGTTKSHKTSETKHFSHNEQEQSETQWKTMNPEWWGMNSAHGMPEQLSTTKSNKTSATKHFSHSEQEQSETQWKTVNPGYPEGWSMNSPQGIPDQLSNFFAGHNQGMPRPKTMYQSPFPNAAPENFEKFNRPQQYPMDQYGPPNKYQENPDTMSNFPQQQPKMRNLYSPFANQKSAWGNTKGFQPFNTPPFVMNMTQYGRRK